ncbi:ATP-dependent helicase HrpB [Aquibium sp. A9E412]|uniref:ATP-dependent helicase HrpB n=1 Tax=Aquibium sp. A9E412 TaxID=2976767 RepID=UPI0025B0AC90|nr:ATP-dependent helicase HrpB [Aquibium sp. A9E412]MDN2568059.1 ATP-dependent helicase HrpB [Aquibium sp. A9E412]
MADRDQTLPVAEALPALLAALKTRGRAVLVAPPGAGKTTLVPRALIKAGWCTGQVVLLEPRRLAARAAARRMAAMLGEEPGGTVGYAVRMERRISKRTRILVVTEGVLTRMILDDPELAGVSALVFDEFHERSLDGDLGLALALDVAGALRPDLRLVVMSATLDGARVARLMGDAPVVESAGRSFPVDIRHWPRAPGTPIEEAAAAAVRRALAEETGSLLVFLPGQGEIARTERLLADRLPPGTEIAPLHGGLDGRAQDAAIRPAAPGRRKVVLATAIAETSLTIEGVRVVIDSGLARLPRYEPATGLTRLETVRAARAAVDQRAGRAGRTEPGVAVRLWRAEQTAALPAFAPPEILEADLTGLVLDCAAFGVTDPATLAFLDPPPAPALAEARALLGALDAIDADGRLTATGRTMRRLALPVRLAHMLAEAAREGAAEPAAALAVLLGERGLGGPAVDLETRLARWRGERGPRAEAARRLAADLARRAAGAAQAEAAADAPPGAGELLLLAFPDRVAMARGAPGRFVLANGRGGTLDPAEPLAAARFLVVADLQGRAANARIAAAAAIDEAAVARRLGARIETTVETGFDAARGTVRAREIRRLGAIVLADRPLPAPRGAAADAAVLAALAAHGLGLLTWGEGLAQLRARLAWLHAKEGAPWPAMDDAALLATLDDWLAPFLTGEPAPARISQASLSHALLARVPGAAAGALDRLAPSHVTLPTGRRVPVAYGPEGPRLAVRVQELYGLDRHPTAGDTPLVLELLSPAGRPLQTTRDLPGFWRGSWRDVLTEMRGRYPKHHWPDDPANAEPGTRPRRRTK